MSDLGRSLGGTVGAEREKVPHGLAPTFTTTMVHRRLGLPDFRSTLAPRGFWREGFWARVHQTLFESHGRLLHEIRQDIRRMCNPSWA